jgi:phenylpyruvate tautomerase PptA (4-oxalocrotonate tautomerase family)
MPVIQVKVIEDVYSPEQKREIVKNPLTRWFLSKVKICVT